MDVILVKLLAAFLALSQVAVRPDAIVTRFDRDRDQAQVVQILREGCAHMRKAFDIESIDIDGLLETALDDPKAFTGDIKAFRGLNFSDLPPLYRQFCKNEDVANSPADIGAVIDWYDHAVADLPDAGKLKRMRLPGMSTVLDAEGERFAEVFQPENRRVWVPLAKIPEHVRKAFVAAEDKRFYEHHGIDERGLIRAMVGNLARAGRPQGGSTITQQVAKNLLVGDDLTYERKIREMIVAARIEQTLTKDEILELYLNTIYLGRGAWGVELAAESYFGKPAAQLSIAEGAMLAGLTKGPSYYNPDRHPERVRGRLAYVLGRMQENDAITAAQAAEAREAVLDFVPYHRITRNSGFYMLDQIEREARGLPGVESLTAASATVKSTIRPALQEATETALQDGLARYESRTGRAKFEGPETNLAEAIAKLAKADAKEANAKAEDDGDGAPAASDAAAKSSADAKAGTTAGEPAGKPAGKAVAKKPLPRPDPRPDPAWQRALEEARLPLYDVHWVPAVVVDTGGQKGGPKVGLADGRVMPLSVPSAAIRRALSQWDVVYVDVAERRGKAARASLRIRPSVQGGVVVLENKTGRILAMAGGFSYPLSQLNRTTQTRRQPGSSLKPFTYLAALHKGLQPNTLVRDQPITLPPIDNTSSMRESDYWTPKNYSGGSSGILTLRLGLEYSKNQVTAQLLDGAIESDPKQSLADVCALTKEAGVYDDCINYYPFVLGAQPARLIDLAAFYAAIANEGQKPTPYAVESIEEQGREVFRRTPTFTTLAGGDRVAFVQLRSMLQGVVARGTANAISKLSPYVAGKTGTSDGENDAWFVGFSNDVTVAVWVGYDNADGKRRTLGSGQTGGSVAVPIFADVMEAAWRTVAARTPLAPPSAQAQRRLVQLPIDLRSGTRLSERSSGAFMEYFRVDGSDQVVDTRNELVSESDTYAYGEPTDGESYGYGYGTYGQEYPNYQYRYRSSPYAQGQTYGNGYQYQQGWSSGGGIFGELGRLFGGEPYRGYQRQQQREAHPSRRVDPQYPYAERERFW